MSEFGEAADLARRAKALGLQEWQQRIMEGSPSRQTVAGILSDNFPSLREPPLTEAQWKAKMKAVAHMDAVNAARREREEKGLPPEPMPTGWHDFGPLPAREPGARVIDAMMDQERCAMEAGARAAVEGRLIAYRVAPRLRG
jgi:hypothetical protein